MSPAATPGDPLPLPTCILAGGLGTRLGPYTKDLPKALVEVAGRPFIFYQIELLSSFGIERVVCCVGHLGEMLEERLGADHAGVAIAYSYDAPGLSGTLGAIIRALPLLGDRFLVLYGDTFLSVDFAAVAADFVTSGAEAIMTVWKNENVLGTSNAEFDGTFVTAFDKVHPLPSMSYIDYGLGGLSRTALDLATPGESDLAALYATLARSGLLRGYEVHERFYEIGTPEALAETDARLSRRGGRST